MSNAELDHNNKVYPSIEGLTHQVVEALEGNEASWYSFKRPIFGPDDGEVLLEAVSYDVDGAEERFYFVKVVVEEIK